MNRALPFALRQALLFTALGLAAMFAVALVLIDFARDSVRADLVHAVDTDIAGLVDIAASGGPSELARRIGDRLALAPSDAEPALYYLADGQGRRLAGNMRALPPLDPRASMVATVALGGRPTIVRATRLKRGLTLAVGRSAEPIDRLSRRLWRAFGWSAAALNLASLIVARLLTEGLGRRVRAINSAFDRFQAGQFEARVGGGADGDEIAMLASHADALLAHTAELLTAQRQISDNIAHELRTPLVHLDLHLLRALEQQPAIPVAQELDAARGEIRSVVSLFDALLDISLAQSAGAGLATVDLSDVAGDVAELYAASAEEAGIALVTRIAPGVSLPGEPMQLARLIANLLDNALKFAPPGSRVLLTLAPGPCLVVEDNGPGVPPEDRERIFQRFARASAEGSGHGLGLALVRVIATRHGLSARAEDAAPGVRFVIERKP